MFECTNHPFFAKNAAKINRNPRKIVDVIKRRIQDNDSHNRNSYILKAFIKVLQPFGEIHLAADEPKRLPSFTINVLSLWMNMLSRKNETSSYYVCAS